MDLSGTIEQPFPPFSGYKVQGRPLFAWAREDHLDEIEIPTKTRRIFSSEILATRSILSHDLLELVHDKIEKVSGDFRQEEICESWNSSLQDREGEFFVMTVRISCSGGTYIRSIAHDLGRKLKTGAVALSIKRTRVGEHSIETALKI